MRRSRFFIKKTGQGRQFSSVRHILPHFYAFARTGTQTRMWLSSRLAKAKKGMKRSVTAPKVTSRLICRRCCQTPVNGHLIERYGPLCAYAPLPRFRIIFLVQYNSFSPEAQVK